MQEMDDVKLVLFFYFSIPRDKDATWEKLCWIGLLCPCYIKFILIICDSYTPDKCEVMEEEEGGKEEEKCEVMEEEEKRKRKRRQKWMKFSRQDFVISFDEGEKEKNLLVCQKKNQKKTKVSEWMYSLSLYLCVC